MTDAYFVYILTNKRNGTLYVGMTNDLVRRVHEHKNGFIPGFTRENGLKTLVYFEQHATAPDALRREKRMKKWERAWKMELIEGMNPRWDDLYEEIVK